MRTISKNSFIEMIDNEFEDFEKQRDQFKGLKTLVDFDTSKYEYEGTKISTEIKPKFKQKVKTSIYIKPDKNSNSLF